VAGAILAAIALLIFAGFLSAPADRGFLANLFFYLFSFVAVVGGLLMITSSNPIQSALWFAAVVLATSGLFLLADASFLAAGTIIVYAGAIIVTFLFVIMLAQVEGRAPYDRAARSPFRATLTCFMLFWALLFVFFHVRPPSVPNIGTVAPREPLMRTSDLAATKGPVSDVVVRAARTTIQLADAKGIPKPHVAGLGEAFYTDYLVTVELAGTLLFVALIGALAIAAPKPPVRPGDRPTASA
jgi:NADH-quinone oxidoreductase subunit J